MLVLGIESSANKLGIGLIKDDKIVFNKRVTHFTPAGTGFIPSETAAHHARNILPLLEECIEATGIRLSALDLIAYTKGPGMAGPLQVGAIVARTLALYLDKPIVPVNHCVAHIEMGIKITKAKNPIILYASGGNTQVIAFSGKYKIFGETLDIAVGNCLDRFARLARICNDPSPGRNIELLAQSSHEYLYLPYTVKGMDVSLTGILSYISSKYDLNNEETVQALCYSLQETIFSALVEVTERAMALTNSNEIMIVGGVGCNERLQAMMKAMARERGAMLYAMDDNYCVDNGAMIAHTGMLMHESNQIFTLEQCDVVQRFRTDTVSVTWKE
ncbi:glycoprotease/Kae1 family metallohydrolase [Vavraia culicis subsp. floridensis]|uniref:N(6)-L-threonylcarbamoyladenine synthase n=1 Tax=Vavraia culicis (isolate floridensis) TaxID=948595 RepID=L2GTN9_VAVCU|nr:glycoprotease/Kae1 family metallohydrolase [Vavraia culicis subsp. floridensis]ELA47031.1 glycoprotease/Kae1 family metallohydrolase [Vavraia culicis subsp. floridensis]